MPYLYQDSKARPAAHPGAARDTHSSGKGYEQLKQECLSRGVLFEDSDFPACNSSLFFSENPPIPFVWKRPGVSMLLCSLLPSCPKSGAAVPRGCTKYTECSGDVEIKCGLNPFPPQEQWLRIGMPPRRAQAAGWEGWKASLHVPGVAHCADTLVCLCICGHA